MGGWQRGGGLQKRQYRIQTEGGCKLDKSTKIIFLQIELYQKSTHQHKAIS